MLMAFDHLSPQFSRIHFLRSFVHEPFGFVSAAEGFYFISGLTAGMVYFPLLMNVGLSSVRSRIFSRMKLLYVAHVVMLISLFILGPMALEPAFLHAQFSQGAALKPSLQILLLGPFYLYLPSLIDILFLYQIFLLITPFVLRKIAEKKEKIIILVSFAVWLISQAFNYNRFWGSVVLPFQNIFAWQFLFILALILGSRKNFLFIGDRKTLRIGLSVSAFVVLTLLLFRWRLNQEFGVPPIPDELLTRRNLAPLRLLNSLALFTVIGFLAHKFPRFFSWRPIAMLGASSIYVYTFHVVIVYISAKYRADISQIGDVGQIVLFSGMLVSLVIPVAIHNQLKKRQKFRFVPAP